MKKPFYITTTLPYVNAEPHIGFAAEIIRADAIARYRRLLGYEVIFNTGTDEHGLKIYRKALEAGKDPQAYCDEYAARFHALKDALNLTCTHFIRTTDAHHISAAREFWRLCKANGDIYKKNYAVKYCVGCELEKTDSELTDGRCPVHPKLDIELIEEENYFFRWSRYQKPLLEWYEQHPDFVVPEHRLNEIRAFVQNGLQDFSISRLKSKLPWGVDVPDDPEQVMYVWFDALVNYISILGWPEDKKNFEDYWPGVQLAGKDNLRQQSAMWTAMLMSAGLPPPRQIFIGGFITADGQKMSKSLGNVINPFDLVRTYGADAVRSYLLGAISSCEDGDYSKEKFEEWHETQLANGLGNLSSRVFSLLEKYADSRAPEYAEDRFDTPALWRGYDAALSRFEFHETVRLVNELVKRLDTCISEERPWEKVKTGAGVGMLLYQLAEGLRQTALAFLPIVPQAAEKILYCFGLDAAGLEPLVRAREWGGLKKGGIIRKGEILFPKLKIKN